MAEIVRIMEGDVLALKKPHPCGANEWEVLGLGVEVKLRCSGCEHIVRVPRARLERRITRFVSRAGE